MPDQPPPQARFPFLKRWARKYPARRVRAGHAGTPVPPQPDSWLPAFSGFRWNRYSKSSRYSPMPVSASTFLDAPFLGRPFFGNSFFGNSVLDNSVLGNSVLDNPFFPAPFFAAPWK